jgi:hypothetical protein
MGVWSRIIDGLAASHDAAVQMIDTSIVRVRQQHGACIKRSQRQLMGQASDVQRHIGESLPPMHRAGGGAVAADQVGYVETWDRAISHNPIAADHHAVGAVRAA